MKVLTLALFFICVSGFKAWEVNKIEEIIGQPLQVLIDSQSNAFVLAQDSDTVTLRRLFKLDPQKNIILEVDVIEPVFNLFLDSNDDFYLTIWPADGSTIIHTIRSGDLKWEEIVNIGSQVVVYVDSDGNLIYNTEDLGVYFLKHNTTDAVRVQNLENFLIYNGVTTDKQGNTYLGGTLVKEDNGTVSGERQFVVITAESKENVPEGLVIDGVHDNTTDEFIFDLAVTGNDELLISITNGRDKGALKKYSNNTVTTIFTDEPYEYYQLEGNDKLIFITSCDYVALRCRMSYLTLEGDVVGISNLLNKTTDASNFDFAINERGDAFISALRKVDQTPLEFLNYTDTETIPIDFNNTVTVVKIDGISLDGNEDLWVLTSNNGLFYLEKGSFIPEEVSDTKDLAASQFIVDKRTNEILLLSADGLYVVTK